MDTDIPGVKLVDLEVHLDARGSFTEFYRASWLPTRGAALQGNISRSVAGTLRAMHFHRHQWDYWFPVTGEMFIALTDLRRGSPTEGATSTFRLTAERPRGLLIPSGVAHGFLAETDLVFGYLVERYYDGSDEWGVAWDDPELGIDWPATDPVLSDRDRSNPSLAEALRDPVPYAEDVG